MRTVYEKLQDCVAIVNGHNNNPEMMSALERTNPDMRMAIHNMYWDARICVLNTCSDAGYDPTILCNNQLLLSGEVYIAGKYKMVWHDTLCLWKNLAAQKPQPQCAGIVNPDDGADGENLCEAHRLEIATMLRMAGAELKKFLESEFDDGSFDSAQCMEELYV